MESAERRLTRSGEGRLRVAAIQRSRIVAATLRAIDDLGYADTSVASIVARAQVSRRTFYELFANREECLAAALADTISRIELDLACADLAERAWRERLRLGLGTILAFFDREPVLARACVVQALGGGGEVHRQRERVLARLVAVVDEGRLQGDRGGECSPLTAEGLVGAAYMILHARLAAGVEPVSELLGELMALIVLPYLGPAAARREQVQPVAGKARTARRGARSGGSRATAREDPLQGLPMRFTYRTARVLEGVCEHPGASNRQVADLAGIGDAGQVSKLVRRLERLGLLENRGLGHARGEPNQWQLTAKGTLVVEGIRMHATNPREVQ